MTYEVKRSRVEEQVQESLARRTTVLGALRIGVDEATFLRLSDLLPEWVELHAACSSFPFSPEVARVPGSPAHRLLEVERELDVLWGKEAPREVLVRTLLRIADLAGATPASPVLVDVSTRAHHRLERSEDVHRLGCRVVTRPAPSLREDVVTVSEASETPEAVVAADLVALLGGSTLGTGRKVHLPLELLSKEGCEVFDQLRRDGMSAPDALDAARRLTPEG